LPSDPIVRSRSTLREEVAGRMNRNAAKREHHWSVASLEECFRIGIEPPAKPKNPRRFSPAVSFNEYKLPNRRVNLHREHPRPLPFESQFEDDQPQSWPGFTPPRAIALCRRSVADYRAAAHTTAPRRSKSRHPQPSASPIASIMTFMDTTIAPLFALFRPTRWVGRRRRMPWTK
jgi:hypothetical protein